MKKIIHVLARVLAVVIVLFFGVFILEGFSPEFTLGAAISHLISTAVVLAIAVIAWKKPTIGGWIFIALSLVFGVMSRFNLQTIYIFGFLVFTGILFLLDGRNKAVK